MNRSKFNQKTSTSNLKENSVVFFDKDDFGDLSIRRELVLEDFLPSKVHPLSELSFADRISSLQWNLKDGVIFKLFEDERGRGLQSSFAGAGELANLSGLKGKAKGFGWFTGDDFISTSEPH